MVVIKCLVLAILYVYLQDQSTPLYVASANGFNDVVKSLLAANADVNCICKVSYRAPHNYFCCLQRFI